MIFAGVVSLLPGSSVHSEAAQYLRTAVSRDPSDRVSSFEGTGFAVAYAELGIRNAPSILRPTEDGPFTAVAGAPLFDSRSAIAGPADDIQRLHAACLSRKFFEFAHANGTFCAVHVDPAARRALLIGDSQGLRPLYYVVRNGCVIFSSALRVLRDFPGLEPSTDWTGIWLLASLKYTVGNRTPYLGVRTVGASQVVVLGPGGAAPVSYFDWDSVKASRIPENDFLSELRRAFTASLTRRLGEQKSCAAFLSGGLDSRCVVAGLRALNVQVHSLNFSPTGSADLMLGRLAAESLETRHFEFSEGPLEFLDRIAPSHEAWLKSVGIGDLPESPRVIWTGYGGDPLLGPSNLNGTAIRLLRSGNIDGGLEAYRRCEGASPPGILFKRRFRQALAKTTLDALRSELRDASAGLERKLHSLVLSDNMRWLVARHYEDIDLQKIDFEFPFLDKEFVRVARSYPLDEYLEHHLYHRWLNLFQDEVRAVAWQTYPGHAPCPVPQPAGLRLQWDSWYTEKESREIVSRSVDEAWTNLSQAEFPAFALRKWVVAAAIVLSKLGFSHYRYLLKQTNDICRLMSVRTTVASIPDRRSAGQPTRKLSLGQS